MLVGLGSLLLWVLLFLAPVRRSTRSTRSIRIALAVFLLCVGISYVLAMSRPLPPDELSPADVALVALASWSGTLLLTQDGIHERARLDTLVWRFVACGGVVAALGLVQVFTRQLWVDQLSIPGLSGAAEYALSSRGGFPRPAGTAIHPIEYGVLLAMLLPLSLHVAFWHQHRAAWIRWLPAIAIMAIIPLSSSRSAYLGAGLALVICMVGWTRAQRLRIGAVAAAGVVTILVVAPNFFNGIVRLFTGASDDPSVASRTDSFTLAFEFIDRNPLFGRGLGTFLPKYRIFDNQFLLLLVTIGIIGTAAFIAIWATTVLSLAGLRRHETDQGSRDFAMALIAAVTAGFVGLFMFDAFAFPMTIGTLFLVIGIAGGFRRITDVARETRALT